MILKKIIGFIILVLLAIGLVFLIDTTEPKTITPNPSGEEVLVSTRTTLSGTYTACLPRHDNFSTEPCREGMKTETGDYYGLDFMLMSQSKPAITEGDYISANGLFTPVEMMSNDQVQGSIGKGMFSVTDSLTITPKNSTAPKPVAGKCYIGGCSSQLCSDTPDMMSTCEYSETYACYQTAKCERQLTGQCGWTPTAELSACLGA